MQTGCTAEDRMWVIANAMPFCIMDLSLPEDFSIYGWGRGMSG